MTTSDKQNVLAILKGRGIDKPIKLEQLSGLSHIDSRTVKTIIQELLLSGERIGGGSGEPYYYSKSADEFKCGLASKRKNILTAIKTYKAMKRTLLALERDGSMGDLV